MVLVWLAMLLVAAFAEGDAPPRWLFPGPLRNLLRTATTVLAALLIAGTLVTSAGPHAGNAATPRLAAGVPAMVQLHADLLVGFLGLLAGLGFALRAVGVPTGVWRRYTALVCLVLAQGTLGVVQCVLDELPGPRSPAGRRHGRCATTSQRGNRLTGRVRTAVPAHCVGITDDRSVISRNAQFGRQLAGYRGRAHPTADPLAIGCDRHSRRIGRRRFRLDIKLDPSSRSDEIT
jgi:hypothetical protein